MSSKVFNSTLAGLIFKPMPLSSMKIRFPLVNRCAITEKNMREDPPNPWPMMKVSFGWFWLVDGTKMV